MLYIYTVLLFTILLQSSIYAVDTKIKSNINNVNTISSLDLNDLKLDNYEIKRIRNNQKLINRQHYETEKIKKATHVGIYPIPDSNPDPDRYGSRIGLPEDALLTADWVDSDGDRIDDRHQSGPGEPCQYRCN